MCVCVLAFSNIVRANFPGPFATSGMCTLESRGYSGVKGGPLIAMRCREAKRAVRKEHRPFFQVLTTLKLPCYILPGGIYVSLVQCFPLSKHHCVSSFLHLSLWWVQYCPKPFVGALYVNSPNDNELHFSSSVS